MYPVNPGRAETLGRSEEFVGEWRSGAGARDRVEIATKVSGPAAWRGGAGAMTRR